MAKIIATADELMEAYVWEDACELKGLNPYAVAEGLMSSDEQIILTLEEARKIGFISGKPSGPYFY